ncbi:hypothetical protein KFE98_03440 [bacterium SCSIO 12741]|nr:hypothetical protein KFE98_03440 [bacterium SCSIO 12741]
MRIPLLIITLLCGNLLSAQDTLSLELDNPAPRVGDKVEMSFPLDFLTDEIKGQLGEQIEMTHRSSAYGSQSDDFTQVVKFPEEGTYTVGPFHFEFNGKTWITDSITLNVAEKLPFEEGVWIRLIEDQEGNKFIIVEQLIQNKSDFSASKNQFSYTMGGVMDENTQFVEIDEISEEGISIDFTQSRSNTRREKEDDIFAPGLSYSFKKYKIKFSDDFEGTFVLQKKHLKNGPKKFKFSDISISR